MADYIRPTPRNPILGLLADALTGGIAYMEDPRRTQQMQGLGGLLSETGIAQTLDRLASGEPLTKGKGFATRMKPETAAAAMTLGPEAIPIGRGAMAAVRATRGLPVGNAIVYHGSPYRFRRFDPTKIGSGEGAQAYGYGHYVSQAPEVAETYRYVHGGGAPIIESVSVGDKIISELSVPSTHGLGLTPSRAISEIPGITKNQAKALSLLEGARGDTAKALSLASKRNDDALYSAVKELAPKFKVLKMADADTSLYTIDLPDPAIARMLDWDKKFSEQPENVQRGILKYWSENPGLKYYGRPEQMTGEGIYGSVKAASLGPEGGARINLNPANQAAAMDLRYQGIPGIRYLDQGSRGAGQGTSNFVVFPGEEDLLRILSVNDGLLAP